MMNSKRLALLRVAKSRLALDEADYRAILRDHGGADSATELTERGFDDVMAHLRRIGFTSDARKHGFGDRPGMASVAQLARIRKLWSEVRPGVSEDDLAKWIEGHFRGGVSSLRFLTSGAARKVIGALSGWKAHIQENSNA